MSKKIIYRLHIIFFLHLKHIFFQALGVGKKLVIQYTKRA